MKFQIILFLILSMFSCNNPYKKAISDFNLHSYYIAIGVINGQDSINIVIENGILYSILNANDDLSQNDYKKNIYLSIKQNLPLAVTKDNLLELKEYEVIKEKKIDVLRKKGINEILNTFFRDGVQYNDLTETEKRYLIHFLFREGILVKTDDETGLLNTYSLK